MKDDKGLPGMRLHLVVARNALNPEEIKFFLSNAAADVPVQTLLLVAFSRWRVERCFEDQKQEVGLDQWEGRRWLGLKRHLILTSVSYLFLARVRKQRRGEKSRPDDLPSACCGCGVSAELVAWRLPSAISESSWRRIAPWRMGTATTGRGFTQPIDDDSLFTIH